MIERANLRATGIKERDVLRGHAPFPLQPAHVTPTEPGRAATGDGHEQGEPTGRCQPITDDRVRAWLTGQELPSELLPEPPSPAAVERLLGELGEELPDADDRAAALQP